MKLFVKVVEARDLCPGDANGFSDPFVRLTLGGTKVKTSVVYKNLNPSWNEEFFFNVTNLDEKLKITVWDLDLFTSDFLGQVKIPVADVLNSEKQQLPRSWFRLEKRSGKSKLNISGDIMLEISLYGRTFNQEGERPPPLPVAVTAPLKESALSASPVPAPGFADAAPIETSTVSRSITDTWESSSFNDSSSLLSDLSDHPELENESDPLLAPSSPSPQVDGTTVLNQDVPIVKEFQDVAQEVEKKKASHGHAFTDKLSAMFQKKTRKQSLSSTSPTSSIRSDVSVDALVLDGSGLGEQHRGAGTDLSESGDDEEEMVPLSFWQDDSKSVGKSVEELPAQLPGGVLVDQIYGVSMKALNGILYKPGSPFLKELTEVQKTTELAEEPWRKVTNEPMKRQVSYRKAPTKLVKAVVASEMQTYTRADDGGFAIFCSVSTPDVPYGKTFLTELLFLITPGTPLADGSSTSRLNISWRMNFLQSTIMKGMIVNGASQGLKESYISFQEVLAKYATPLDGQESTSTGEELIPGKPKTDWELAREYFGNWTVLLTVVGFILMIVHIFLVTKNGSRGLEVWGIDLPDSVGEVVTVAFLFRQVERVGRMVQKFFSARFKASDHGVKAQGDGWLLTVTLLGAENLYSIDTDGSCDPYVVFTCNGKMRTSSVILGSFSPHWDEVYEFDATEDPPSTMDIEVFDYDGPFSQAESLGQAMINFLKTKPDAYADVWLPLSGSMARSHDAKLHLRVMLTNTRSEDVQAKKYTEKVQRAAGTKLVPRSMQRNTQFQKLFGLPQEEFLINDYACAIKRKIPIQGRLFLSPRMVGFYSNLFGHKTKFSFLWEDIEEMKESAPSRGVLFNPSIMITLRKGRTLDGVTGLSSRSTDYHGRVRLQFLSFVRPGPAFRTIIALWKNRALNVEQTLELITSVDAGDLKYSVAEKQVDDSLSFTGLEDAQMTFIEEVTMPATLKQLVQLFEYSSLDHQIMETFSVSNYKSTHWEVVGEDKNTKRRQVSYVMSRQQCPFGSTVTSIQQKTISSDFKQGQLEELITLHDVPFADHFQVQVRKVVTLVSESPPSLVCKVYAGTAWNKEAGSQDKITKNILNYMTQFLRDYMQKANEIVASTPPAALEPVSSEKESSVTSRGLPNFMERFIKPSGRPSLQRVSELSAGCCNSVVIRFPRSSTHLASLRAAVI